MKKLQNNFTTPEQSKRLLEIGVPVDSADMYFQDGETRPIVRFVNSEGFFKRNDDCSPCWSVGRLLEIYLRCADRECFRHNEITFDYDEPILAQVYELFVVAEGLNELDFSKLEE